MNRSTFLRAPACLALLMWSTALAAQRPPVAARADGRDSARALLLETIQVDGRSSDLIGSARTASEGRVGMIELRARPLAREGEMLETVPGVIVTQHSGGGKANQYFVRGFNLDHGTDFQTRVEGMPVNQPSHAHGQGYTDLNFLIPEFVHSLDYRLGVAHAELGDFGSAGGAEFSLATRLDRPIVNSELGSFGLARAVIGRSTSVKHGDLLLGGEAKAYDGPWVRAEGQRKFSGIARYTRGRGPLQLSVLALGYSNRWNASDQIPVRLVQSGRLGAFGQVDSTLGGSARRYSLSARLRHVGTHAVRDFDVYGIYSTLDLFSNFTYFLDDPVRGDQFEQVDRRAILGGSATQSQEFTLLGATHLVKGGMQSRADIAAVALHRTSQRVRHATVRSDDIRQASSGIFIESESRWNPRFRTVLGARADGYLFDVEGDREANAGRRVAGIVSPKASIIFTPRPDAELYLSGGFGFHSNDARGSTITVDPATGEPARAVDPLVRSRGAEVGARLAPVSGLRTTLAVWALQLDSELLFVGDAGATEPTTASVRRGVTVANFFRPTASLALDADVSFAHARLTGVPGGAARIPGALEAVIAAGIAWAPPRTGVSAALRIRHFGAYPLSDDNQTRAPSTTMVNGTVGLPLPRGLRLAATALNLLNSHGSDIQYLYQSRLSAEAGSGVTDVHVHPVEPRQVRLSLGLAF